MDGEAEVGQSFGEWLSHATLALQVSGIESARRDAQAILSEATGLKLAGLLLQRDSVLTPEDRLVADELLDRRASGMPLAYAIERQDFYQLRLFVDENVLIPRPDTETLVDAALEKGGKDLIRVLDIGTGSGAIAIALAYERPGWTVLATDVSPKALEIAALNAEENDVSVEFFQADIWPPLEDSFDLIVSNPPYIADDEEVGEGVREYEPHLALFSGPTGLEFYERIIPESLTRLAIGGWLMFEVGYTQAEAVERLMVSAGYVDTARIRDLGGIERVVIGRWPG